MKISFDLDDTLIPGQRTFATERMNLFQKLLGVEPIRKGTVALMRRLKADGHSICIYTTSFRTLFSIRLAFWTYGIFLNEVINQRKHNSVLGVNKYLSSKYPPAFNIDLHIDDLPGVGLEGKKFNFSTIIIKEDHAEWVLPILVFLDKPISQA